MLRRVYKIPFILSLRLPFDLVFVKRVDFNFPASKRARDGSGNEFGLFL